MRSNYKPLGDYIQEVNTINSDLSVNYLRGISSIYKCFIKSKANIVGVDFLDYKIVRNGQFAFNPNTARMGDKIPIALNDAEDCIVSKIYPVFEISDKNKLLPEYLMMWFRRPEFDRYARFMSHGSAREIFGWEEMCNTLLPVPSITKQKEIVKEYNVIKDRIALNQQIIQKLEETAQAIYKQWFVDEADKRWSKADLKKFGNVVTGKTPSSESPEDFGRDLPFITPGDFKNYNKFALGAERNLSKSGYLKLKTKILSKGTVIVTCIGSDMGKIAIATQDCITNQQMNSIIVHDNHLTDYLYYYLKSIADEIKGIAMGGSTMPMLSKSDFEKIEITKPDESLLKKFHKVIKPVNELNIIYSKENQKLLELKELLLSKLATVEENL